MSRRKAAWPPDDSERFRGMVDAGAEDAVLVAAFPGRKPPALVWRAKMIRDGLDPSQGKIRGAWPRLGSHCSKRCLKCREMFLSYDARRNWICENCRGGDEESRGIESATVRLRSSLTW